MTTSRIGARGRAAVRTSLTASLVLAAVALPALASTPAGKREKASSHVSTSGPPVPQSAEQRAALVAKRARAVVPSRASESAPTKGAPISTLPGSTAAVGRKAPPPVETLLVPSAEAQRAPATSAVRRAADDAAIAAFIASLGPDIARRAGLVKATDRGAGSPARPPASRTSDAGAQP